MKKNDTSPVHAVPAEYDVDADFAQYAAKRGLVPGSAQWALDRRQFDLAVAVPYAGRLDAAAPRPAWSEPSEDWNSRTVSESLFGSLPWSLPLDRHPGQYRETEVVSARAELRLRQRPAEVEPYVEMRRLAALDGASDFEVIDGSGYRFTLDEAAELAHLILLVVDVARETAADPDVEGVA